jgi:hypothetical protein
MCAPRHPLAAAALALLLTVALPSVVPARGSSHSHSGSSSHSGHGSSHSGSHHGKHKRSKAARDAFMRSHPCPSNGKKSGACPGYVVDHIKPLKRGGEDAPSNMQWQTIEQGKAKDRWE